MISWISSEREVTCESIGRRPMETGLAVAGKRIERNGKDQ